MLDRKDSITTGVENRLPHRLLHCGAQCLLTGHAAGLGANPLDNAFVDAALNELLA
jgi:hypothetical protein